MTSQTSFSERSVRRRREVCDAARRVIARNGLEVTTLRDISREGGFTTGVVTHHFQDKRDVVVGAFASASREWIDEVRAALDAAATAADVLDVLVRVAIPDDARRQSEWRLWSEMWTYAGRDAEFAAQLVATDALWEEEIRRALERLQADGMIAGLDIRLEAALLARLIDGLGLRASLSGRWSDARRQLLFHLEQLGVPDSALAGLCEFATEGAER
jgi:AcrR family transcriptional regulator